MKKKRNFKEKEKKESKKKNNRKNMLFELTPWKKKATRYIIGNEINDVIIYSRRIKGTGSVVAQIKIDSIGSTTRYWVHYFHDNIRKFSKKYEELNTESKLKYSYGRELDSIDILKLEVTLKLQDYFVIKTL